MSDARSNSYISMNQRKPFKVVVCAITLVAFFVNTFAYDLAWAGQSAPSELTSVGSEGAAGPGLSKELNVATFKLPDSLGTIRDSWSGKPTTNDQRPATIIHIQDAHCNYGSQSKVAEIVEYLNKEYDIDTINLEGGAREYDLSPFTDIKDKALRAKASDYFVKEGLVNGAEYFAVNNPEKVTLWGMEDPKLYVENLGIYRNSLKNKEAIDKYLKSLSASLSGLKTRIYSKELFEFDLKYTQYKAANIEFNEYLSYLIRKTAEMSVDIKKFSDIYILSKALDEEAAIDFEKADNERGSLIDALQKKLSKRALEELVVKTVDFEAEKISQKDYYSYLAAKAQAVKVDLKDFPELERYIAYISMDAAINKPNVAVELESLENTIRAGLCRTDEERKLSELSKNLALLKNIFGISISRQDYEYYKKNKDAFGVRKYVSFVTDKAPPYGVTAMLDDNIRDLDKYREYMIGFYECSLKRDKAFLKNLHLNKSAVVITGGFHTDNLAELFKKNNISYVSIMPNFRNEESYVCEYYKLLSGEKSMDLKAQLPSVLGSSLALASPLNPMLNKLANQTPASAPLPQPIIKPAEIAADTNAPLTISPAGSRGMSGLDNSEYTEVIRNGIASGSFAALMINGRNAWSPKKFTLDNGDSRDIALLTAAEISVVNAAMSSPFMSDRDRKSLENDSAIIFIEGLDDAVSKDRIGGSCYGAHYGVKRNQYYIDTKWLSDPEKLAEQLHHEIQERMAVVGGITDKERMLPTEGRSPALNDKINELARSEHARLVSESAALAAIRDTVAADPQLVPPNSPSPVRGGDLYNEAFGVKEEEIREYRKGRGLAIPRETRTLISLAAGITHITFAMFIINLSRVVAKLNTYLAGKGEYAVIWDGGPNKSSRWVYELCKRALDKKAYKESYFYQGLGRDNYMKPSLEKMYRDGVKTFVLMDDAMYRGVQMSEKVEVILDALPYEDINIVIMVPYTSTLAKKDLTKDGRVTVVSEVNMLTVSGDFPSEQEIDRIMKAGLSPEDNLYYFDHKLPDLNSFPSVYRRLVGEDNVISPYKVKGTEYSDRDMAEYDAWYEKIAKDGEFMAAAPVPEGLPPGMGGVGLNNKGPSGGDVTLAAGQVHPVGQKSIHSVIEEGMHPAFMNFGSSNEAQKEDIKKVYRKNGRLVIPIKGLVRGTGLLGHIGLGQYYGEPVIYVDADLTEGEKADVLAHEQFEIEKWETHRAELGKNRGKKYKPEEMRAWIRQNSNMQGTGLAQRLAQQWHNEAPDINHIFENWRLNSTVDEHARRRWVQYQQGRIERAFGYITHAVAQDPEGYKSAFKKNTGLELDEIVSVNVGVEIKSQRLAYADYDSNRIVFWIRLAEEMDDDELIWVLGHEFNHHQEHAQNRRNDERKPAKSKEQTSATMIEGQKTADPLNHFDMENLTFDQKLKFIPEYRESIERSAQEEEFRADQMGVFLLARAGRNPNKAEAAFIKVGDVLRDKGKDLLPGREDKYRMHPDPRERLSRMVESANRDYASFEAVDIYEADVALAAGLQPSTPAAAPELSVSIYSPEELSEILKLGENVDSLIIMLETIAKDPNLEAPAGFAELCGKTDSMLRSVPEAKRKDSKLYRFYSHFRGIDFSIPLEGQFDFPNRVATLPLLLQQFQSDSSPDGIIENDITEILKIAKSDLIGMREAIVKEVALQAPASEVIRVSPVTSTASVSDETLSRINFSDVFNRYFSEASIYPKTREEEVNLTRALGDAAYKIQQDIIKSLEDLHVFSEEDISVIWGILDHAMPNAVDAIVKRIKYGNGKSMSLNEADIRFELHFNKENSVYTLKLSDNGIGISENIFKHWKENEYGSTSSGEDTLGRAGLGVKHILDKAKSQLRISYVSKSGDQAFRFTQRVNGEREVEKAERADTGTDLLISFKSETAPGSAAESQVKDSRAGFTIGRQLQAGITIVGISLLLAPILPILGISLAVAGVAGVMVWRYLNNLKTASAQAVVKRMQDTKRITNEQLAEVVKLCAGDANKAYEDLASLSDVIYSHGMEPVLELARLRLSIKNTLTFTDQYKNEINDFDWLIVHKELLVRVGPRPVAALAKELRKMTTFDPYTTARVIDKAAEILSEFTDPADLYINIFTRFYGGTKIKSVGEYSRIFNETMKDILRDPESISNYIKAEGKLKVREGFDYNNTRDMYLAFVGVLESGVADISWRDFMARMEDIKKFDGKYRGYFKALFEKGKSLKDIEVGGYVLKPQGFLGVFRGRANMVDCSFDRDDYADNSRDAKLDRGQPYTRAMQEDTLYYFIYKGNELKGYVGLMVGKTADGSKVLTINVINSPSLDGKENLTELLTKLAVVAGQLGCVKIALPKSAGSPEYINKFFNFPNRETVKGMDVYRNGTQISGVVPLNQTTWDYFTEPGMFSRDQFNSMEGGEFALLDIPVPAKKDAEYGFSMLANPISRERIVKELIIRIEENAKAYRGEYVGVVIKGNALAIGAVSIIHDYLRDDLGFGDAVPDVYEMYDEFIVNISNPNARVTILGIDVGEDRIRTGDALADEKGQSKPVVEQDVNINETNLNSILDSFLTLKGRPAIALEPYATMLMRTNPPMTIKTTDRENISYIFRFPALYERLRIFRAAHSEKLRVVVLGPGYVRAVDSSEYSPQMVEIIAMLGKDNEYIAIGHFESVKNAIRRSVPYDFMVSSEDMDYLGEHTDLYKAFTAGIVSITPGMKAEDNLKPDAIYMISLDDVDIDMFPADFEKMENYGKDSVDVIVATKSLYYFLKSVATMEEKAAILGKVVIALKTGGSLFMDSGELGLKWSDTVKSELLKVLGAYGTTNGFGIEISEEGGIVEIRKVSMPVVPQAPPPVASTVMAKATPDDFKYIAGKNPDIIEKINTRITKGGNLIVVHFRNGEKLELPRESTRADIEEAVERKIKELEALEAKRAAWNKRVEDLRERINSKYPGIIEYILPNPTYEIVVKNVKDLDNPSEMIDKDFKEFTQDPEDAKTYLVKYSFAKDAEVVPIEDAEKIILRRIADAKRTLGPDLIPKVPAPVTIKPVNKRVTLGNVGSGVRSVVVDYNVEEVPAGYRITGELVGLKFEFILRYENGKREMVVFTYPLDSVDMEKFNEYSGQGVSDAFVKWLRDYAVENNMNSITIETPYKRNLEAFKNNFAQMFVYDHEAYRFNDLAQNDKIDSLKDGSGMFRFSGLLPEGKTFINTNGATVVDRPSFEKTANAPTAADTQVPPAQAVELTAPIDTVESRQAAVTEAFKEANGRSTDVRIVQGVPLGSMTSATTVANGVSRTLAKSEYGVRGNMQIFIFEIDPENPDKTTNNMKNAVTNANTGLETGGRVVIFAPNMDNGLNLTGEFKQGANTTVLSDAYTDYDYPDMVARMALARNISYYYESNDADTLKAISGLLEKIAQGQFKLDAIDDLFKLTIRIKPIDYNKDIAFWKNAQLATAVAA